MPGDISYEPNIPASSHNPSNDQPQMQQNNDANISIWQVDHVGFNTNFSGCHNWSTYLDQGSDPGSLANSVRLYAKSVAGVSNLYFQRDNLSPVTQLTGLPFSSGSSGYAYLQGGILMQWVQKNSTGSFTWPISFPTACFGATLGYNNAASGTVPNLTSVTQSGATLNNSGSAIVFIIAIGN